MALSLILSLLLFKPAPVYILDEVDAALDLSHTQVHIPPSLGVWTHTHTQVFTYTPIFMGCALNQNCSLLQIFHLLPLFPFLSPEHRADVEKSFPKFPVHRGVPQRRNVQQCQRSLQDKVCRWSVNCNKVKKELDCPLSYVM